MWNTNHIKEEKHICSSTQVLDISKNAKIATSLLCIIHNI